MVARPKAPGLPLLRRWHQVKSIARPAATPGGEFRLRYTRTATDHRTTPVLVIPGGPGLASVVPYLTLRSWAQDQAIDLLMVEHRGVGFSRRTVDGRDLGADDLWLRLVVDDLRAVLDAENIERATLYGSSYGSYLAQAFAVEHPGRVAALLLDSPVLSAHDHTLVRELTRAVLWDGDRPGTSRLAAKVRGLVADGLVTQEETVRATRQVYELCGPAVLERLLDQVRAGRGGLAWRGVLALSSADTEWQVPLVFEFDLVGTIAFRELNFAPVPDGLPFDPGADLAGPAARFPPFEREPYDLTTGLSSLTVPVVVLSGEWDLQAPRAVAQRIAGTAGHGHLVLVPGAGHSLLDTHPRVARAVLSTVSVGGAAIVSELEDQLAPLTSSPPVFSAATVVKVLMRLSALVPSRRRFGRAGNHRT